MKEILAVVAAEEFNGKATIVMRGQLATGL